VHEEGALDSVPENEALPCALSATGDVSVTVGELLALQTSAPATFVTGPGVPLTLLPLITSPSTLNATSPVIRLTKAKPPVVVHGEVPLAIPPTGFEVPGAVITPVIVLQNTTLLLLVWATSVAVAIRDSNTTANAFFIGFLPRFRKGSAISELRFRIPPFCWNLEVRLRRISRSCQREGEAYENEDC
jgi:hypothetical protein